MAGEHENSKPLVEDPEQQFLSSEYTALIDLDRARNERLDRILTIFMTLAAAPWALYALTIKDHQADLCKTEFCLPTLIAIAFIATGILGSLIAMMYIQVWFNVVLYMRALNAIRKHFLKPETLAFNLPRDEKTPPYLQWDRYIELAVIGMAVVNSFYVALGIYAFSHWDCCFAGRFGAAIVAGLSWFGLQVWYCSWQGANRQKHSSNPKGELRWD
jgi:uncharacterized membrane protein YciS (DUF1049 family)